MVDHDVEDHVVGDLHALPGDGGDGGHGLGQGVLHQAFAASEGSLLLGEVDGQEGSVHSGGNLGRAGGLGALVKL